MDGETGDGVDGDCLDANTTPKDYIAIPFSEVKDSAGAIDFYGSLFCLGSLEGKTLECKKFV